MKSREIPTKFSWGNHFGEICFLHNFTGTAARIFCTSVINSGRSALQHILVSSDLEKLKAESLKEISRIFLRYFLAKLVFPRNIQGKLVFKKIRYSFFVQNVIYVNILIQALLVLEKYLEMSQKFLRNFFQTFCFQWVHKINKYCVHE